MKLDHSRDALLTPFGKATLKDRYLMPGETFQEMFARVATAFADDEDHAQRLYDYMSKHWFMPATPILSNGGTKRGLPISCFLSSADDNMEGIVDNWIENAWLASKGGGVGTYWGRIRSIGERVGSVGTTSGVVPFMKVQDSMTLAISQGSLRRGSAAVYLPINHPEIEEFLEIRSPTGGDINRKCLNLHQGICISDEFMLAVDHDADYSLRSPKTGEEIRRVRARTIWQKILKIRHETGEPYLLFVDTVNDQIPEWHKRDDLKVETSNLCTEITLPTGPDRTAVCCLSSLNLERSLEWIGNEQFIEDVVRFLDNVLQSFIDNAPATHAKAVYSAIQERSVGLGVMGYHGWLQQCGVGFASYDAEKLTEEMFSYIKLHVDHTNYKLSDERGSCPDAVRHGFKARFSNVTSIAPTASISGICGGASPGIDPIMANAFTQKTLSGSFMIKNRYLEDVLDYYGENTQEVWSSIITNEGSVQHLDFLSDREKEVFKTAHEIDQMAIIRLAAIRQKHIDQAQSVNLFVPARFPKRQMHKLHFAAWERGLKSLYYCRSKSIRRAEAASVKVERVAIEECESCQ